MQESQNSMERIWNILYPEQNIDSLLRSLRTYGSESSRQEILIAWVIMISISKKICCYNYLVLLMIPHEARVNL